jgi:CheY-like chemotaxis protein
MAVPGSQGPAGRPLTVLHVEDDPDDVFFVRHAFQKAAPGVALVVVIDGRDAQSYLVGAGPYADRARHPMPDLVLMDLKLPRMTGLEVLEWMKGQDDLREIPVFILSSSSEPSDVERAHSLGVNGYLAKQASVGALVEIVKGLMSVAADRRAKQQPAGT